MYTETKIDDVDIIGEHTQIMKTVVIFELAICVDIWAHNINGDL